MVEVRNNSPKQTHPTNPVPSYPANALSIYTYKRGRELLSEDPNILSDEWSKIIAEDWARLPERAKENFIKLSGKFNHRYRNRKKLVISKWRYTEQ